MRTPTDDDKLITPQGIVVFKCEEEQSSKKAEDPAFHFCALCRDRHQMVSQMHSPHLLSQECFVLNRLLLGWRIRGHSGGNLFLENQPDVRNCFVSLFDACFISYKRGCVPRDTLVYIQRQQIGH